MLKEIRRCERIDASYCIRMSISCAILGFDVLLTSPIFGGVSVSKVRVFDVEL